MISQNEILANNINNYNTQHNNNSNINKKNTIINSNIIRDKKLEIKFHKRKETKKKINKNWRGLKIMKNSKKLKLIKKRR